MRNRPDSRSRLATLRPARLPHGPDAGEPVPSESKPREPVRSQPWWGEPTRYRSADRAFGQPADDEVRQRPAGHRRPEPQHLGGWVPDTSDTSAPPVTASTRQVRSAGQVRPPERRSTPPDEDADVELDEEPEDASGAVDDSGAADDPAPSPEAIGAHHARRVRHSPHHAWGRVAQRWIPEPLREARIDPGRRGAVLLTVVAAVAAVVAAVGVWRDQPAPRPVQAVSLAQVGNTAVVATGTGRTPMSLRSATSPRTTVRAGNGAAAGGTLGGDPTAGPTASGPEVLIVSVTGAVRHPGLVRLPPRSRVADAIAQAGGATSAADLTGLNLAARLADGASVVVSDQSAGGGSSVSGVGDATAVGAPGTSRSGQPAGKVDLNTADATTLDALPGVGPVTAAAIVAWREKNGRYTSVEQLQEIQGIGPAKYAALAALVTV